MTAPRGRLPVEQAGYACFLRRDFLEVLRRGEEAGVRHDVFLDFLGYLRRIEEARRRLTARSRGFGYYTSSSSPKRPGSAAVQLRAVSRT